jgi:hypothetical protein
MQDICRQKAEFICSRTGRNFGYVGAPGSRRISLYFLTLPGVIHGWLLTRLEKATFYLPFALRTRIITYYRVLTGSLMPGKHV